ncbi:MAG: C-GCAxxG-C-C family protein [Candidatus Gastranaerophilales bacterium]
MKKKAVEYFNNGFSCSESIVKAAIDEGFCSEEMLACSTSFSGGMSSGCLCGAIAGGQIVLGSCFGRKNKFNNPEQAREKSKELIDGFVEKNKHTCCRILSKNVEGQNKKQHCSKFVNDVVEIVENLLPARV